MSGFVCVYPEQPSAALTEALLACGFQPVPVDSVAGVAERQPEGGWQAAVVELGDQPDLAAIVAGKLRDELDLPVLLVADRTYTSDLLEHSEFDDFILTPLDRAEFRVRMAGLGAADAGEDAAEDVLRFRDLELNTATYQATVGGDPCDLTYMEYELLRFFVANPVRVWSREQILSKVWGYDYFGGSRTVDVHVRRLRAKLGEERSSWISTVRSVGYRFG